MTLRHEGYREPWTVVKGRRELINVELNFIELLVDMWWKLRQG